MAANRNARAQSRNADSFDGDSDDGNGRLTFRRVGRARRAGGGWEGAWGRSLPGSFPPIDETPDAAPAAPTDTEEVARLNRSFYEAFEQRDLDAMADLWEHSDRVLCTHPGWATLRGWAAVASSFFALFQSGAHTQFLLTGEQVVVAGDTAWVSIEENILGDQGGVTVAALNIFARPAGGGWLMLAHHGSAVVAPSVVG
ncbi:MAG TPA: nuclear transport factor 2 family protein [Acidimicrobiales bacterium]|nr:nuclear transport factor 2 family protein [Acidimicrobiales bacterium]